MSLRDRLRDKLQQHIDETLDDVIDIAKQAMHSAVVLIHAHVPEYPPPPAPGTASKFWTAKQRRWFWSTVKRKPEMFNYIRTGTLSRKITEDVTAVGNTVHGVIGTKLRYSKYVIGARQAAIHRGRWWRFVDVWNESKDDAFDEFTSQFYNLLQQRWGDSDNVE